VGLASEVVKLKNDIATPVYTPKGTKKYLRPLEFYNAHVVYPDQFTLEGKKLVPKYKVLNAMYKGKLVRILPSKAEYYMRSPKSMFAFSSNLVPFLRNTQGNRSSTAGRMIGQAVSLTNREAPLVQTKRQKGETYEDLLGSFLNPILGVDDKQKPYKSGVITSVDTDYISIKTDRGDIVKRGLYNNFPLNQDGFLHSTPLVKVGDKVTTYSPLSESNYSVGDTLAIGKNLTVAYMPYKGYNFEDGAVLTNSASKKLSHQTLHKLNIFFSPKLTFFNLKKFQAWFPETLTPANTAKLDAEGLPKIGETFQSGEMVAAYLVEKEMDDTDRALKRLNKLTFSQYSKRTLEWDEDEAGTVTDVKRVGRNVDIYIKAAHPFKEGDKLSGRYGNKYIVTKIIPDSEAPHRKNGDAVEIMLNPHGVPSRMNGGQLLETAAAKIALKTGKPYIVDNFADADEDVTKRVLKELKDAGISPDEVLTDGATGQAFENPIFTGTQYFMKLRHIVKKKQGVHSYGSYDIDEQPVGKGAQKTGVLDTYSYLAHGAKKNLYEMTAIKGRNNEEY
jgi:DNA-directed RNA polymerase subunit beta